MDVLCSQTESHRKVLIVERRRCPHCNQNLSLKTYKAHKRRYYNLVNDTWLTKEVKKLQDDFDFSDNESLESPPNLCQSNRVTSLCKAKSVVVDILTVPLSVN